MDWLLGGLWNRGDDPLLADEYGRLSSNSPYIDFGDNAAVAAYTLDLDENARFVDDPSVPDQGSGIAPVVDRGAFEFQPPPCDDVADSDCDGIQESNDNCPAVFNPDQSDFDNDTQGDACDADIDGDGVDNAFDICDSTPVGASVQSNGSLQADLDQDCDVDLDDFSILIAEFTGAGSP